MSIKVTATIHLPGDRSVGIGDSSIELSYGHWLSYPVFFAAMSEGREEYRKCLELFGEDHEQCGPCRVVFGDECWECLSSLTEEGRCTKASCINNQPDGAD